MWDVGDVGCWGCGMLVMWDVGDVGSSGCGMFGMWDVPDVGCSGCGMFGMWEVQDVGCGMLAGIWSVDLQNAYNGDINKFILLLTKGVYPIYNWERFNIRSLPDEKAFYSKLNLEDVTDKYNVHARKVLKNLN